MVLNRSRSQSTAMIRVTSSAGSPTALSTITMVTRPAWGTPAAPMLAAVAVMLMVTICPMLRSKPFSCAINTAATAS
nr:antisense product of high-affinity glutamate transporter EAAC1 and EAAC2 [Mus musculus]